MSERKRVLCGDHQKNVRHPDHIGCLIRHKSQTQTELQRVEEKLVNVGQQRQEATKLAGPSGGRSFTWFFHKKPRQTSDP